MELEAEAETYDCTAAKAATIQATIPKEGEVTCDCRKDGRSYWQDNCKIHWP